MIVDKDARLRTTDGVTLYADVYRPDDSATHPALLIRTPYGRRESTAIHIFEPADAVARGFGVVVQDVRGRYQSEGVWDPYESEASDGAASVAWVAGLPWCDGGVGMYGASYQGAAQL